MYSKQLIATEMTVVAMRGAVLRQPTVSISADGQNMYIKSVRPTLRTPATPNQRRARTANDTQNPTNAPIPNASRVATNFSHGISTTLALGCKAE